LHFFNFLDNVVCKICLHICGCEHFGMCIIYTWKFQNVNWKSWVASYVIFLLYFLIALSFKGDNRNTLCLFLSISHFSRTGLDGHYSHYSDSFSVLQLAYLKMNIPQKGCSDAKGVRFPPAYICSQGDMIGKKNVLVGAWQTQQAFITYAFYLTPHFASCFLRINKHAKTE
jgi:hypothetical protein